MRAVECLRSAKYLWTSVALASHSHITAAQCDVTSLSQPCNGGTWHIFCNELISTYSESLYVVATILPYW